MSEKKDHFIDMYDIDHLMLNIESWAILDDKSWKTVENLVEFFNVSEVIEGSQKKEIDSLKKENREMKGIITRLRSDSEWMITAIDDAGEALNKACYESSKNTPMIADGVREQEKTINSLRDLIALTVKDLKMRGNYEGVVEISGIIWGQLIEVADRNENKRKSKKVKA